MIKTYFNCLSFRPINNVLINLGIFSLFYIYCCVMVVNVSVLYYFCLYVIITLLFINTTLIETSVRTVSGFYRV